MKVLVTGANSPIGYYFINKLMYSYENIKVIGTYSREAPKSNSHNIKWIKLDLSNEMDIDNIDLIGGIDNLVHFSSITPGNFSGSNVNIYYKVNVDNSTRLVDRLLDFGLKNVFFLSSVSVYDETSDGFITESSKKTTTSHYGLSKLNFEEAIKNRSQFLANGSMGVRVPILLTQNVRYNFLSRWKELIRRNQLIPVYNIDQRFNAVCSAECLFEIYDKFINSKTSMNSVINVFSSDYVTMRQILTKIYYSNFIELPDRLPNKIYSSENSLNAYNEFSALEIITKYFNS